MEISMAAAPSFLKKHTISVANFPIPPNLPLQFPQFRFRFRLFGSRFLLKTKTSLIQSSGHVQDVPVLSAPQAIETLRASRESTQRYLAMYSSVFGGIILDQGAMVIPMDDHMVHRGHGVFDTAAIVDGYLYELEQHLDRFLGSASKAKINPPFDKETTKRILVQTVTASSCKNGSLRYWLSSGPGDFQLSPSGCHNSSLYAIVIQDQSPPSFKGIKVITSSVPIKPPQFATMKSVNYLPNVLSKMEAEENGAYAAIWLDEQGFVAEGPNMNVAFVTRENELLMPGFDKILSGCTARRLLELVDDLVQNGKLRGVQVRDVSVEEGKQAQEMMLIGSGVVVRPVLLWDDQVIGNGKEGVVTESLRNLILEDMKNGPSTDASLEASNVTGDGGKKLKKLKKAKKATVEDAAKKEDEASKPSFSDAAV